MSMANSVEKRLFEITPEIQHLAELCEKNNAIDKELYSKYEVKRGLRDAAFLFSYPVLPEYLHVPA